MKYLLVDQYNRVVQIDKKKFDVHTSWKWVEVKDSVTVDPDDIVNPDNSIKRVAEEWSASAVGKRVIMVNSRQDAYGSLAAQLDEIYHDQVDGTTKWKDRITKIKTDIPKVAKVKNADGIEI